MYNKYMFTEGSKQNSTEESDAGQADPAGTLERASVTGRPLSEEELRELRDGPPPGWRSGFLALNAAGVKAEEVGKPSGFEKHATGEGAEGHIVRGLD